VDILEVYKVGKNMWLVRAGEAAYLVNEFLNKGIIAIGWNEVGDLTTATTSEKVKSLVKKNYPDYKDGKVNITAGQLNRFRSTFNIGDSVLTYDPDQRIYHIGTIKSDYEYNESLTDMFHIRRVNWFARVLRDDLSPSARNTLGAISTIIEIPLEVQEEIIKLIKDKGKISSDEEVIEEQFDSIKEDILNKAHEFIKDKILSISWDEMQELVAGLLRAMGYKTRVSKKGPDRGRDILASPDGLGLEEPRIIVEVKHRSGQMGANEIRSFTGGLRSGDRGLYVSTGGFTKEAKYEAERSTIPISIIDSDILVELIIQYYDNFDAETKALIPLKKIYWPV